MKEEKMLRLKQIEKDWQEIRELYDRFDPWGNKFAPWGSYHGPDVPEESEHFRMDETYILELEDEENLGLTYFTRITA